MKYVLVNGDRMYYLKNRMKATSYEGTVLKKEDTLVLPLRWEQIFKKENWDLSLLNNGILYIPFHHEDILNENVFAYMENEFLLCENAKLTALGMLIKINEMSISYNDTSIDIIGAGRCGLALHELFVYMNIAHRMIHHTDIHWYISSEQYRNMNKGEIIINTCDTIFLKNEEIKQVKYIFDLSSKYCFKELENQDDTKIMHPGSLPEIYFAQNAAYLIENYIRGSKYEK